MARGYEVFNAAQIDWLDLPSQPVLHESARIDAAKRFFANLGIATRTEGDWMHAQQPGADASQPDFADRSSDDGQSDLGIAAAA